MTYLRPEFQGLASAAGCSPPQGADLFAERPEEHGGLAASEQRYPTEFYRAPRP